MNIREGGGCRPVFCKKKGALALFFLNILSIRKKYGIIQ